MFLWIPYVVLMTSLICSDTRAGCPELSWIAAKKSFISFVVLSFNLIFPSGDTARLWISKYCSFFFCLREFPTRNQQKRKKEKGKRKKEKGKREKKGKKTKLVFLLQRLQEPHTPGGKRSWKAFLLSLFCFFPDLGFEFLDAKVLEFLIDFFLKALKTFSEAFERDELPSDHQRGFLGAHPEKGRLELFFLL